MKNSICHSYVNRNLLIIKQIPAGVYPDAIGARMTDGKKSIFQKTLYCNFKYSTSALNFPSCLSPISKDISLMLVGKRNFFARVSYFIEIEFSTQLTK